MNANLRAFLTMITISELGKALVTNSDRGYNVLVGSTPDRPLLFTSYADHPRQLVIIKRQVGKPLESTAAGAYQILSRYYDAYKKTLKLPDFSPASQDAIATQMLKEQGALMYIYGGEFEKAVFKCKNIWASLPGAGYGQNEHPLAYLEGIYTKAGGFLV